MTERQPRILAVDDEEAMREVLRVRLAGEGYEVATAGSVAEALTRLESFRPEVVISDVKLPDGSGVDLLRSIAARRPGLPVVLITAHGSIDLAVEAMKEGARDFLTKPLDYGQLRSLLAAIDGERRDRARAERAAAELREGGGLGGMVGRSAAMRRVFDLIEEVAATDAAVFLVGESGTGKEMAARAIHGLSARRDHELVAVNAAAIPAELMESEIFGHEKGAFTGALATRRGCFEVAHGGTLLLDEIAEMPLALQPKLLRVLEDGMVRRLGATREIRFDVRVIAATNQDPLAAVREGRLRRDLYYRLNIFPIELPPLRRRAGDVPLVAQHFIRAFNEKHGAAVEGVRAEALARLEAAPWPGNVRELRNVIERGVVLAKSGWLELSHLPPYLGSGEPAPDGDVVELAVGTSLEEAERRLILQTLEQTGQNKAEAARRLGIDVKTVRNKLKRWSGES